MSTYHVLNAIWIGVFPMLTMAVAIATLCYILCCLNQIKVKCKEYRKRKQLRKTRKKLLKQQQRHQHKRDFFELDSNNTPLPQLVKQPFTTSSSPPYADSYTNSYLHNEIKLQSSSSSSPHPHQSPPPPGFIHSQIKPNKETRFAVPPFNLTTRSSLRLDLSNHFKPITSQMSPNSSPEKATIKLQRSPPPLTSAAVEQLVVEDLKESPTSAYSRLNTLARLAHTQKVCDDTSKLVTTTTSPTQPPTLPLTKNAGN